jgi:hypothetical protein
MLMWNRSAAYELSKVVDISQAKLIWLIQDVSQLTVDLESSKP